MIKMGGAMIRLMSFRVQARVIQMSMCTRGNQINVMLMVNLEED